MAPGEHTAAATSPEHLLARHREAFRARLRPKGPVRLFLAPGRVNLMGAHLDYNGGPVMPMAVDRGTFLAVAPRTDGQVCLASTHSQTVFEGSLGALPEEPLGDWVDYPLGVLAALAPRAPRGAGLDVLFGGNLPVAAGLSSSASICVGTAFALSRLWDTGLDRLGQVRVALAAEREFVGVRCGIMDPFAVGLARAGHLLLLDCKDETCEHVPLDTGTLRIGVVDSGVRRELAQGEFNRRVAECGRAFEILSPSVPGATCLRDVPLEVLEAHQAALDETLVRRARHVLTEVRRTLDARDALRSGDAARFGRRMFEAHESLRCDYEVSCPELDCLVESGARCDGVLGARLTGAGFGGCAVFVLRAGGEEELVERVGRDFERRFGRRPQARFFSGAGGPIEVEDGGGE